MLSCPPGLGAGWKPDGGGLRQRASTSANYLARRAQPAVALGVPSVLHRWKGQASRGAGEITVNEKE